MDDLAEALAGLRIPEDHLRQRRPVEGAPGVDQVIAKGLCNLRKHGGTGSLDLVDDGIGIHHGNSERFEDLCDGALAGADSAGEAECEGGHGEASVAAAGGFQGALAASTPDCAEAENQCFPVPWESGVATGVDSRHRPGNPLIRRRFLMPRIATAPAVN